MTDAVAELNELHPFIPPHPKPWERETTLDYQTLARLLLIAVIAVFPQGGRYEMGALVVNLQKIFPHYDFNWCMLNTVYKTLNSTLK